MATQLELFQETTRQRRVIEGASEAIQEEITKVITNYYNGVLSAIEGDTDLLAQRAANYANVNNRLYELLADAGFERLVSDYEGAYPGLTSSAQKYFKLYGINRTLADINAQSLDAVITYEKQSFRDLADRRLVKPMTAQVIRTQLGSFSRLQARSELRTFVDKNTVRTADNKRFTDTQLNVFAGDSYARYHREVSNLEAEEVGLNEYIYYSGPGAYVQEKPYQVPRPACRRMLEGEFNDGSRVWRKASFTLEGVNQALPRGAELRVSPAVAGGGFNCRHMALAISRENAIEYGYSGPV